RYFPTAGNPGPTFISDPIGARQARARALRPDLEGHWRAAGRPAPTDAQVRQALITAPAPVRAAIGLEAVPPAPATDRRELPLTAVRDFLMDPVQAWARHIQGLPAEKDEDRRGLADEP